MLDDTAPVQACFGEDDLSLQSWLTDFALPFWAETGFDADHGGFFDRVDADGVPYADDPKSALTHGRQLYAFTQLFLMSGDERAKQAADRAFDFLTVHLWDRNCDGFYRSVGRDGDPEASGVNPRKDAYDHAFALLGMSLYSRVSDNAYVREWIRRVVDFLDHQLRDVVHGGVHNNELGLDPNAPYPLPRSQNPHMHLLEALLVHHETTGDDAWLQRAAEIVDLFKRRFFDASSGSLREFMALDMSEAPAPQGRIREPGHQFEWFWLLQRYAKLSGDRSVRPFANALYSFALAHGVDRDGPLAGAAFGELSPEGEVMTASKLLWPQTEAVKAHLAWAVRAGSAGPAKQARTVLDIIFRHFVTSGTGHWKNHLSEDGKTVIEGDAWARLFYHLIMAISEALSFQGFAAVAPAKLESG